MADTRQYRRTSDGERDIATNGHIVRVALTTTSDPACPRQTKTTPLQTKEAASVGGLSGVKAPTGLFLARIVSRVDVIDATRASELNLEDRLFIPRPSEMGVFRGIDPQRTRL